MSSGPDPNVNAQVIEQERRKLGKRLEEVARLCEGNVPPGTFYAEMLKRLLESLAAPAGAVWTRTPQGHLQQQVQINVAEIGLDSSEEARQSHDELLRALATQPRPLDVPPRATYGNPEPGKVAPGNPTDYLLLLVPIMQNEQCSGLLEVWQGANRARQAIPGFLQFMQHMGELATRYQRNQMIGQMAGQQQLWTQLEAFARQIHASLNITEVSYIVANDGRRLVDCDRVSVAVRRGTRTDIEAVSGADTVEHRSNLVRLMRRLSDEVLTWGEKLVFTGTRDDALPPRVLDALDAYLAESQSKLLVVMPQRVEREAEPGKKKKVEKPRSALVMECFDPQPEQQTLLGRLEVVSKHAAPALHNALEYSRIPFRFIWEPLAKLQEGVGGTTKAILLAVIVGLCLAGSALVLLPYPLKMDATGRLVPEVRITIFPQNPGLIEGFGVEPGEEGVKEGRVLVRLFDEGLREKLNKLILEAEGAKREAEEFANQAKRPDSEVPLAERTQFKLKAELKRIEHENKNARIKDLIERIGAERDRPGHFVILAPKFTAEEARKLERKEWMVLSSEFREMKGKIVRPGEPIMRLGARKGPWELEIKIPQKHIGQVRRAFARLKTEVLEVDFLVRSDAVRVFRGKLYQHRIAGEAVPNRDENATEPEPVVVAYVRIDDDEIHPDDRLPPQLQHADTEVRVKIRCGDHAAGYSLFYGVWEFLYEKVVFFF